MNYEANLIQLWEEVNNGTYEIGRSVTFIVDQPVKREIFAADFRDRIIHHLLMNKLMHLFEREFIYDSYSCRKGKGGLLGVKRLSRFIRSCSAGYTQDCYVLKMDIQSFFMSIDRSILLERLRKLVSENYHEQDKGIIIHLMEMIVTNDCTEGCIQKTPSAKWKGLPSSKSLFGNDKGKGLPIGNFTSQVFANYYLSQLDHYIKSTLGVRYYSRYVDDFVIVHQDKAYLKSLIPLIRDFLHNTLLLKLHPRKIQLQHYRRGVKFVGAYILPGRVYIEKRTKTNLLRKIYTENKSIRSAPKLYTQEQRDHLFASVNSYLGFMRHYKTYKLRKRALQRLSAKFDRHLVPASEYRKLRRGERASVMDARNTFINRNKQQWKEYSY